MTMPRKHVHCFCETYNFKNVKLRNVSKVNSTRFEGCSFARKNEERDKNIDAVQQEHRGKLILERKLNHQIN